MDAQGSPESSLGVVSGGSGGSPGALLSAAGLLWGSFWSALGAYLERFRMISLSPGDVQRENSEKLYVYYLLNENAVFLKSPGLQHERKIVLKRAERRHKSREEANRAQRGDKSALQSVLGALWGTSFDFGGPWGRVGGTRGAFRPTSSTSCFGGFGS